MVTKIYTIGHSNHSVEDFIDFAHQTDVDAVGVVHCDMVMESELLGLGVDRLLGGAAA